MATVEVNCTFCGKPLIRKSAPSIKTRRHFCNLSCKAEWQRTQKPVSKEWLHQMYIFEQMDCTQIAHIVHRDPKSVWNWLKDFGIPTRGRGYASPNKFKQGQESKFKGKKHTKETREIISKTAKSQGRVPYDPAIGSYMKGRKGKDTPNWKGGVTPERQTCCSSKEWSEAVKSVWERDKAICQRCGKDHNKTGNRGTFHVHHIVSFENKSLRCEVSNLVLLCSNCHYFVHSKKNVHHEFLRENVQ